MNGSRIVGHFNQRSALHRLAANGKLPASVMFAGQSGTGKRLVALELCGALLCERGIDPNQAGGCGECKACRLLNSGNHPDFHFLQCRDREGSNVAAVRELLFSLNLNPFISSKRVVIFDNIEHLSQQSANALLKTLEEPRPGTYFFLITANPSRLPSTLVSRCQIWFFDALAAAELQQILETGQDGEFKEVLSHVPAAELAVVADGSLEGLQSIAMHLDKWQALKKRLATVFYGNVAEAVVLASELAKDKEGLRGDLQLMRIRAREQMLCPGEAAAQSRWAVFLTNLIEAERLIFERNLAPLAVLSVCLLSLCGSRQLAQLHQFPRTGKLLSDMCV